MPQLTNVSLKIANHKSFGPDPSGFDRLPRITVVIGRNNAGKSGLLDLVEFACDPQRLRQSVQRTSRTPTITISEQIDEADLTRDIPPALGSIPRRFIGTTLVRRLELDGSLSFDRIEGSLKAMPELLTTVVAKSKPSPFLGMRFARLNADRDITPQTDSSALGIQRSGHGFTNTLQQFVNQAVLQSDLVEDNLLRALNAVFQPDATFTRIQLQKLDDANQWEVFLHERGKGRIRLSECGSGLKTVLLVLSNLELTPACDGVPLSRYIFGFEELENNIHPALQRRLFRYVRERAVRDDFQVVFTTHSHIGIDLFAGDPEAQLIHVIAEAGASRATSVSAYSEHRLVLDDLDVRASDLLQANGVVWVEGPSDRAYFNRWIELATEGQLREGQHYQCVSYGGRLLSHLSAADPSEVADAVSILRVNRNAMVVIDSDISESGQEINATKSRIRSEVEDQGGLCWITEGRTIEHYLPVNAIALAADLPAPPAPPAPLEDFATYLDALKDDAGRKFNRQKVAFAATAIRCLTKESLELNERFTSTMRRVVALIKSWNGLPS